MKLWNYDETDVSSCFFLMKTAKLGSFHRFFLSCFEATGLHGLERAPLGSSRIPRTELGAQLISILNKLEGPERLDVFFGIFWFYGDFFVHKKTKFSNKWFIVFHRFHWEFPFHNKVFISDPKSINIFLKFFSFYLYTTGFNENPTVFCGFPLVSPSLPPGCVQLLRAGAPKRTATFSNGRNAVVVVDLELLGWWKSGDSYGDPLDLDGFLGWENWWKSMEITHV